IEVGLKHMTPETMRQYQREERSNIANRMKVEKARVDDLLLAMKQDRLSHPENTQKLRKELADFYEEDDFLRCESMGDLVAMSLEMLFRKPNLYKDY
ncbi:MAG: hypothetical protein AAGA66_19155, partial [Bacteroidota bacterium]